MSIPTAWDPEGLRAKAALYFERAFEHDHDEPLFAFWCHMAIEPLARAAVASVNPALLAAARKEDSLLYGLGLADADPLKIESTPGAMVYDRCVQFVEGFGHAELATCNAARHRRNAELHSAVAGMEDLPRGWLGRFFAACRVLMRHLGLGLEELLDAEHAALVERLIVDDAAEVRDAVTAALAAAKERASRLSSHDRSIRERAAEEDLRPRSSPLGLNVFAAALTAPAKPLPRILREVACPACTTPIALRGEVLTRSPIRLDEEGLPVETEIAVPTMLHCAVCEFRLEGMAQLAAAGFSEPITLKRHLDPVEAFDVDLSDYRDEFLESLVERHEYRDE